MIRLLIHVNDDPSLKEFADEAITIGRSTENHLVLRDHRISRRHARLEWNGDEVQVFDLQSGNGTFLNGRKLRSGIVKAGDLLVIGPMRLKIVHLEATDLSAAAVRMPVQAQADGDGSTVLVPDSGVARTLSRLRFPTRRRALRRVRG